MKAKTTVYKGCRFRSRLEARWAVAFDQMGVLWEYEPQGFETKAGAYLPDFYLPEVNGGVWLEIKPPASHEGPLNGVEKIVAFSEELEKGQLFVLEGFPSPEYGKFGNDVADLWDRKVFRMWNLNDEPFAWCVCPYTLKIGIQYFGRGARINKEASLYFQQPSMNNNGMIDNWSPFVWHNEYSNVAHGDKAYSSNHPILENAWFSGNLARFEHGENGTPPIPVPSIAFDYEGFNWIWTKIQRCIDNKAFLYRSSASDAQEKFAIAYSLLMRRIEQRPDTKHDALFLLMKNHFVLNNEIPIINRLMDLYSGAS